MKLQICGVKSVNLLHSCNSHGMLLPYFERSRVFLNVQYIEKLGDEEAKVSPGIVTTTFSSILCRNRRSHVCQNSFQKYGGPTGMILYTC